MDIFQTKPEFDNRCKKKKNQTQEGRKNSHGHLSNRAGKDSNLEWKGKSHGHLSKETFLSQNDKNVHYGELNIKIVFNSSPMYEGNDS